MHLKHEKIYIKREIWHLGRQKKQNAGSVPILGALTRPLLVSAAGIVGGEVLKGLRKKIGEKEDLEEDKWLKDLPMPRNNILLQRLPAAKRLQLPNGPVFFAKYQRVGRHVLAPTCVRIARTYVKKIRPRRQKIRRIGPRNR